MNLRPYQQEAYDCTLAKLEEADSTLCVMATGTGKTIYAAHIVEHYRKFGRIMILAHREELIMQAQDKMKIVTGKIADIEMGDNWARSHSGLFSSDIVVSTIQTQIAGREGGRMTRFNPEDFSLVIVDEAHRSPADSYRRVIAWYQQNPKLKLLGLTATPDRLDKKALGQIFETVAYEYGIEDARDDGWLVPVEVLSVFVDSLDYSGVGTTKLGELNGKDLAKVLEFEENLHAIADPTVKLTGDMKTLIFTASVAQAERLAEIINRHKPGSANYICGETPKETRREILADYREGRLQYLINVGVFAEGYDEPGIQCVVLASVTKSRSRYAQWIGRGMRVLTELNIDQYNDAIKRREVIFDSAKPVLLVLDFVGNAGKHKLITAADVLGGKYPQDVIDLAAKNGSEKSNKDGKPVDVANELELAEREIHKRYADKEFAKTREMILLRTKFSTAKVNPFDILDINPIREIPDWEKGKQASPKQLAYLKKNGIDVDGMAYTHIKQVIDNIFRRRDDGKPSPKQIMQLKKRNIDPSKLTRKEAGNMMRELANSRPPWSTPRRWKTLDCWVGNK